MLGQMAWSQQAINLYAKRMTCLIMLRHMILFWELWGGFLSRCYVRDLMDKYHNNLFKGCHVVQDEPADDFILGERFNQESV